MGLDVGTKAVKALLVDLEGRFLSRSERRYRLLGPREGVSWGS